ncbi:L-lysine 6-monooxygenase (NADPH-requiring)-domain-containing protein [Pseudomassariella vexata]|uniref:L-ornithine N(5)-monooxygenase [NAD(P)H] n=1 Tax=Pseudomassariella vexata TaxID=1141098 RepID=A0A1Y2DR14_9PEZI|nr:L-lysine 6-monooxygenase (NADPH-requiring)-domain-containing protein [Pseudomassariella vexata]ORY61728.1 L-lysine 6-monooxygenase (NADPH-requiring)-domain-containing protein [Pseudomassariella vexata]
MSPHSLVGSHIDGPPFEDTTFAGANGFHAAPATNGQVPAKSSLLKPTSASDEFDLICVGFGPASLAIAVALNDALENGSLSNAPKVLFLEKQTHFKWHSGMLLPGAKMQISYIKDLATLRDPRSHFTFMNFLHKNGRLVDFINLGTFLPARVEYEEYMRWCAEHFEDVVLYGQEVVSVSPQTSSAAPNKNPISQFSVTSRTLKSGEVTTYSAKNVLVAVGGTPNIPKSLPANHPKIIHSSQYINLIPKILTDRNAAYRVAVIGAGQSAAEIFSNLQELYPNSSTSMVMRAEFLKPSDDSPFVNCIFNPEYIDSLYPRSTSQRMAVLKDARATNYAVVRLELIEKLFGVMYHQKRVLGPDERKWPHRIMGLTEVLGLESDDFDQEKLKLRIRSLRELDFFDGSDSGCSVDGHSEAGDETLEVDLIIAATGYQRTQHLQMMEDVGPLLPEKVQSPLEKVSAPNGAVAVDFKNGSAGLEQRTMEVARDYSVRFAPGKVAPGSGIYLQGCNEKTHGLSDTLLSVLATRSGEMVETLFGAKAKAGFQKK